MLVWPAGRRAIYADSLVEGCLSGRRAASADFFFFFQISFSLQKIQDHEVLDVLGRAVSSCL